jgi:hypothetical protein
MKLRHDLAILSLVAFVASFAALYSPLANGWRYAICIVALLGGYWFLSRFITSQAR